MFSAEEIIATAQMNDLKQEEERRKAEKAAEAALAIKSRLPAQYNVSQLLEKLTGGTTEAPKAAEAVKPIERKNTDARFPPPPTSR